MKLTAIILAGGKSSRMGTDKALLKLGGGNMLQTVIRNCEAVCSSIIISSNNTDYKRFGYLVIPDEIANCGPIGGIYSCLKQSATDLNFIISVDTPFVSGEFINFLTLHAENFDIVCPIHSGGIEPLIAVYNKNILSAIEKQIKSHNYKIQNLIHQLNTKFIDADNWIKITPLLFKNLNNPEDLEL